MACRKCGAKTIVPSWKLCPKHDGRAKRPKKKKISIVKLRRLNRLDEKAALLEMIVDLRLRGRTLKQIALEVGKSYGAVRYQLNLAGGVERGDPYAEGWHR